MKITEHIDALQREGKLLAVACALVISVTEGTTK